MHPEAEWLANEMMQAWYAATDHGQPQPLAARIATTRITVAIRDAAKLYLDEHGAARSQLDFLAQSLDRDVLELAFILAVSELAAAKASV